jgi:hypothetical protein
MRKILKLGLIILLLVSCDNNFSSTKDSVDPIIKIAYDSLSTSQKNEIEGDWKNATLKKEIVNNKTGVITENNYIGKEVYIVVFYTGSNNSLGDIDVYVSKDKNKVIGGGYRE